MPDDGYDAVDVANLPLGATTNRPIIFLGELNRTNAVGAQTGRFNRTIIAICAGDDAAPNTSTMWIVRPDTAAWEQVTYTASGQDLMGDRERLHDMAVMAEGSATRAIGGGVIDQPCAVFCNGVDRVAVYPEDAVGAAGQHQFGTLTNTPIAFIAKTCEAFNGRIYYGNTTENGTNHRQRIRRSPLFDCDPNPATIGSGAMDLREFSGDLLRLEKLGNVMAAYFEDGTAFVRSTDVATSPDAVQILRERRGLLSTFAVTSIGDQEHFGIFDDGWYILDASGRFSEVGVANIGGQLVHKWRRTFYENLDMENRHRLLVSYDGNLVRIIYPRVGYDDAEEVWIYDPRADRVWIENYDDGNNITYISEVSEGIATDLLWSSSAADFAAHGGNAWSLIIGSWASMGAKFGLRALVHGNNSGHVMIHNPDYITRYNTNTGAQDYPSYEYHSPVSALGEPRLLKTARQLWVEYIHAVSPNMTVRVVGNSTKTAEQYVMDLTPTGRQAGEVLTARQHFNFTDTELGFQLEGTSPILIRSLETDYLLKLQEERV
jgi:hypothetical protein